MSNPLRAHLGFEHPQADDGYAEVVAHLEGIRYREEDDAWIVDSTTVVKTEFDLIHEFEQVHIPRERVTHFAHDTA